MDENFVMSRNKLIDRLSDMYHTDCLAVADCCDKVLDRSGALLGEVRERHSKIYGAGEHISQQPHAACPEGETGRSCETCNYWKSGMCWGESCTDFSEWEERPASA